MDGIRYFEAVYDAPPTKELFLVLFRFVSLSALPFALVFLCCYERADGQ